MRIYSNNTDKNGLNQHGNSKGAEKWSDSEHILKAGPTEIANMKWRGVEDDSKDFGLRNWNDRVAIKIVVLIADND